jgi:hypothetical protein
MDSLLPVNTYLDPFAISAHQYILTVNHTKGALDSGTRLSQITHDLGFKERWSCADPIRASHWPTRCRISHLLLPPPVPLTRGT